MEMLCKEVGDQYQVRVALHAHDVPAQLPPETALCLYRILQEALQNAAKHSGVREFDVRLWGTSDDMNLQVRDRGSGFRSRGLEAEPWDWPRQHAGADEAGVRRVVD